MTPSSAVIVALSLMVGLASLHMTLAAPVFGSNVIPANLGVTTDFVSMNSSLNNLPLLTRAGWTYVQNTMEWSDVEYAKPGVYDFSAYAVVVEEVEAAGLSIIFSVTGNNALYNGGNSPSTPESVTAFTAFFMAAVKEFAGRGIGWELWFEPDVPGSWLPAPSASAYSSLALAVGQAFTEEFPSELLMGPAVGNWDFEWNFPFMETVFAAGALDYFNVVSFHAFGLSEPETYLTNFGQLEALVEKYQNNSRPLAGIACTQWGLSANFTVGAGANSHPPFTKKTFYNETDQAFYFGRMYLSALSTNTKMLVMAQFQDTAPGTDFTTSYGTLTYESTTKLSYNATKHTAEALRGFQFEKRLDLGLTPIYKNEYAMQYANATNPNQKIIAIWTADTYNKIVPVPVTPGFNCYLSTHIVWATPYVNCADHHNYMDFEFTNGVQFLVPVAN